MNNFIRIGRNAISWRTRISSTPSHRQLWHQFSTTSISSSSHSTSPVGIAAVIQNPTNTPRATIFDEFALHDRVAIITGGNQNLGLEQSLALSEAGVRAVYCIDLPSSPSEEWKLIADYIKKLGVSFRQLFRLSQLFNAMGNKAVGWNTSAQTSRTKKRCGI